MSEHKKMGRPTESPKDYMYRIRMDKETVTKLNAVSEANNIPRSEVIRKGIDIQYDSLKKE